MNILFVCSRNQWRSPTAEAVYKNSGHSVRSAGMAESARIRINEGHVSWADIIFVMERRHRDMLKARYEVKTPIIVLDIPDEYGYMDEELVSMIKDMVDPHLL